MKLLVATAPWPILVKIVTERPGPWTVWGSVPAAVADFLTSEGHRLLDAPFPRPLHRHPLPEEVSAAPWQAIVVPALGHPLPTRWPIVRYLAGLGAPVIVSDGTSWQWVHHEDVPEHDAYTWAMDRLLAAPAEAPQEPEADLVCVRGDFLGDLVLAWPAVEAAARSRRVTLVTARHMTTWVEALATRRMAHVAVDIDDWAGEPRLPAAAEAIALSGPNASSPLTPALTHAVPACRRAAIDEQASRSLTIAELLASALGVELADDEGRRARTPAGIGLLCPNGSTPERELDAAIWPSLAQLAGDRLGIDRWTIVGLPRDRAAAMAAAIPGAVAAPFPAQPYEVIEMLDTARVTLGVSSTLTHLSALRGVSTIAIAHPTRSSAAHELPGRHVEYIRPSSPWWRAQPDATDVARARVEQGDSYGFWPGELEAAVEQAARALAIALSYTAS